MALDCFNTVRNCISCAKHMIKLRKHASFMKLFPARCPREHVAIDILGPLPRTRSGYMYIVVITDRYSKMTAVHPLRNIAASTCAKAFCDEWVFKYGQPSLLLSDRGTQFTSDFSIQSATNLAFAKRSPPRTTPKPMGRWNVLTVPCSVRYSASVPSKVAIGTSLSGQLPTDITTRSIPQRGAPRFT